MRAMGLNFADLHRRRGNYSLPGKPPHINGYEGAGVVVAKRGDRGDARLPRTLDAATANGRLA